jgi:hypothetical protein
MVLENLKLNSKKYSNNVNYKLHFNILILYSILSIIFTYPVAFSGNVIPGGLHDCYYYLWDFWWFKTAVLNFSNPYYTQYMYYPYGVYMWFADNAPFNALLSIPLQLAFGLTISYNIIWILTFIFSGYTMFLLVKYLTRNSNAAFISGLVFMFCPYRFAHALCHMNLISTMWIPLYILYFLKLIDEPKKSNILIISGILLLNVLSSFYYVIYLIIFSLIYIIYNLKIDAEKLNNAFFKRLISFLVISVVFSLPLIYPMFKALIFERANYMYAPGFVYFSADLIGFLTPSIFQPVFKNFVSGIYSGFTGNIAESTVFVGYTVIILSILAILKIRSRDIIFWTVCSIIFLVLSLGPLLHVNGLFNFKVEDYIVYLPLPYSFLMRIPILSLARVTSRWDILLVVSLSVLVGYMMDYISFRYVSGEKNKKLLYILISSLILFEFLAIPYPTTSVDVPYFYHEIANDKEDYAIMEIPNLADNLIYPEYLFYQTVHGKKLIGGYVGRAAVAGYPPIIEDLMSAENQETSENASTNSNQTLSNEKASIFYMYNIKYIILHKDLLSPEQIKYKIKLLDRLNIIYDLYENSSMIVYKVPRLASD